MATYSPSLRARWLSGPQMSAATSQTPHIRKENATRRRSGTTTTPSLDQVRNLFVVSRSIDRSGPGQARPARWKQREWHRPKSREIWCGCLGPIDPSWGGRIELHISLLSVCGARHNDTTTQRHNDHSQLLQVRNSFVVYRSKRVGSGRAS